MSTVHHDLDVVGLKFRWNKDLRGEIAKLVNAKPMTVEIEREPENEYDPNALMVVVPTGTFNLTDPKKGQRTGGQLGYIRADSAAVLAEKIDGGTLQIIGAKLTELRAPDYNEGSMEVTFKRID
jgi:hypothetical protein